jgi:hypothetical protein
MKLYVSLMIITLGLIGCKTKKENLNAQKIVDIAIEVSGKEKLKNSNVSFVFRDHKYLMEGNCGNFVYNRIKNDSIISIKDVYDPKDKLRRYVNDTLITLTDSTANKYAESINSVMYFIQLPYRLNDIAVNKAYAGIDSIKGKAYHKIAVNFDEKGGGTDYQDNYFYWFGKEDYKLYYLAYNFVVNGGGIRFREAYNQRYIDGIRFVDYKNYKPKSKDIKLNNISKAFENKDLELLSVIENNNIKVDSLNKNCE